MEGSRIYWGGEGRGVTYGVGVGLGVPVERAGGSVSQCRVLGEDLQRGRGVRIGLWRSPEGSEARCRGSGVI